MESIFLPQQLYLEWTCCDSGRRFPPWGKQFLIRAVRTATCRCRLTAPGRAGLNAPSAMGSIPSNATARTAGFRASCDRQNKVAPVLAGLAAPFHSANPAPGRPRKKRPQHEQRAEARKVGEVCQVRVNAAGAGMVPIAKWLNLFPVRAHVWVLGI